MNKINIILLNEIEVHFSKLKASIVIALTSGKSLKTTVLTCGKQYSPILMVVAELIEDNSKWVIEKSHLLGMLMV